MKNKFLAILVFLITIYSCGNNNTSETIFLHSLQNDKIEKLSFTKIKNEALIEYNYTNDKDSIKNIFLKYDSNKNVLISDLDTFLITNKIFKTKKVNFGMYQSREIKSHYRTFVFNEDYGLFATLGYGANFLFLKDSTSAIQREIIYKQLFLNLNEISIE
jgi:hypothetical protein